MKTKSKTAAVGNIPDAALHNPDPDYLRDLLARAGLSQRKAAAQIGISDRLLRYYLAGDQEAPYPVQYCLERMAARPQSLRVADSIDGPIQRPHEAGGLPDGWYWFAGDTYDVPRPGRKFRAYVMAGETMVGGRRYAVDDWKGRARVYGPVPEAERAEPRDGDGWREL